jgi:flagellum-specific peptidoglycan hydrolase FlgJ
MIDLGAVLLQKHKVRRTRSSAPSEAQGATNKEQHSFRSTRCNEQGVALLWKHEGARTRSSAPSEAQGGQTRSGTPSEAQGTTNEEQHSFRSAREDEQGAALLQKHKGGSTRSMCHTRKHHFIKTIAHPSEVAATNSLLCSLPTEQHLLPRRPAIRR